MEDRLDRGEICLQTRSFLLPSLCPARSFLKAGTWLFPWLSSRSSSASSTSLEPPHLQFPPLYFSFLFYFNNCCTTGKQYRGKTKKEIWSSFYYYFIGVKLFYKVVLVSNVRWKILANIYDRLNQPMTSFICLTLLPPSFIMCRNTAYTVIRMFTIS